MGRALVERSPARILRPLARARNGRITRPFESRIRPKHACVEAAANFIPGSSDGRDRVRTGSELRRCPFDVPVRLHEVRSARGGREYVDVFDQRRFDRASLIDEELDSLERSVRAWDARPAAYTNAPLIELDAFDRTAHDRRVSPVLETF